VAVRVPRDTQELAARVDRVSGELASAQGRQPSVDEVARELETDRGAVLEAMAAWLRIDRCALDVPRVPDDGGEALVRDVGRLDDGFARAEDRVMPAGLMASLTRREREIVRLGFQEDLTQAAIGDRFGISQMQVSRLLRHALAQLRRAAEARSSASGGGTG
jgi:RNA polymerase sigma-B factor